MLNSEVTAPGFEESWLAWSQIQRYHGQPHGAFGADEHLAGWGCGMVMGWGRGMGFLVGCILLAFNHNVHSCTLHVR